MIRSRQRTVVAAVLAAALLSACGGPSDDTAGIDATTSSGVLAVTGTDALLWDVETLDADAGVVDVALRCESGVNHNFVIAETDELVAECAPGETVEGSVELGAGTYTYLCTVPGHESRMIGELRVS